jgi:hypothetical protein
MIQKYFNNIKYLLDIEMNITHNGLSNIAKTDEIIEVYSNTMLSNINNSKYMSKAAYNRLMNLLDLKHKELIVPINVCIHKTETIIDNLDKLKQALLTNNNKLKQLEPLEIELGKTINNKYLETGSKMSKLALASLPQSDEELDKTIMASLNKLNLSDDEKSNARDFYMNAVNTERQLGGRTRKTNRKTRNRNRNRKTNRNRNRNRNRNKK